MHQVEYEYKVLEGAAMTIDIDPALDPDEKEAIVLAEIRETFDDGEMITDIEITDMKELN
jgi:hypothetical protein